MTKLCSSGALIPKLAEFFFFFFYQSESFIVRFYVPVKLNLLEITQINYISFGNFPCTTLKCVHMRGIHLEKPRPSFWINEKRILKKSLLEQKKSHQFSLQVIDHLSTLDLWIFTTVNVEEYQSLYE